jgi:putative hydrolase of HD superfamily
MEYDAGSAAKPNRTFPPLYRSQGDEGADRLAFFHVLERLKV